MTRTSASGADAGAGGADLRVRRLIAAARSGGFAHLVGAVQRELRADAAFFDLGGNVLSSAPARTLWDFERVRARREGAVVAVEVDGETVGLLAARTADDPERLLPVAADLLALELAKFRAQQLGQLQLLSTLFDDIFSSRVSDADAAARLAPFGISAGERHRVLVGWDPSPARPRGRRAGGSIYALLEGRPDPLTRVPLGDQTVMIVPDDAMVRRLAETLHADLGGVSPDGGGARVGVGLAHAGVAGLRASYAEALTAVQEGAGVRSPQRVDLSKIFAMTNTAESFREVARAILQPVLEHDRAHGSDLARTLRVYLECNRGVQETTEALFVHRNTLRYRRAQLEELLGMDLDESAHIANLWLAFAILDDASARVGEA